MKQKLAILCYLLFLAPSVTHADISLELNGLLKEIFSDQKPPSPVITPPVLNIPDATPEALQNFQTRIREEEVQLQQFEQQILDTEAELFEIEEQRNQAESALIDLDQELTAAEANYQRLRGQEQFWEERLANLTKEISRLRTQIRIEKQELNKLLSKNFVRSKNLGTTQDDSIFYWLFSNKTVSQILLEKDQSAEQQRQRFIRLRNVENLERLLAEKEKKSADFFHKLKPLRKALENQKNTLLSLSNNQASTLAKLEDEQALYQNRLEQYLKREAEAQNFLAQLKVAAEQMQQSLPIENITEEEKSADFLDEVLNISDILTGQTETKWQSPLPIPLRISAKFQNPAYENQFGREHLGVDFAAPQGTDILAPTDGTVIKTADNGYDYSYVIIDHGNELYSLYGHVSAILVNEGDVVTTGEVIGQTGGQPGERGSGYFTTGPHLHLEIFENGEHIDPLLYIEE